MKAIIKCKDSKLWICSMGKRFKITAIAETDEDANEYCKLHKDEGVIATYGNLVFMANLYQSEKL